MVAAIIALIMALVSFFGAKKSGASDGEAALAAAAVGAGTYYVSTETEWGKGLVDDIENWVGIKDSNGDPLLNNDGEPVKVPEGAEIVRNPDGTPKTDSNGNVLWKLVDEAGNTLQSWGGVGTAAVIGAGAVASDSLPSWVLPAGLAVAALVILK